MKRNALDTGKNGQKIKTEPDIDVPIKEQLEKEIKIEPGVDVLIKEELEQEIKIEPDNGVRMSRWKNEFESIWNKLELITHNLVGDQVSQNEINDILCVISRNPFNMTCFNTDYGSHKVEIAINEATTLLYSNGRMDLHLSEYLWCKRDEIMNVKSIKNLKAFTTYNIASTAFDAYVFHITTFFRKTFEIKARRAEFKLLMAVDPNRCRENVAYLEIGQSKIEIVISQCIHVLESIMKQRNSTSAAFLKLRNRKIRYEERFLKESLPNYDEIFKRTRCIVTKYWRYELDDDIDLFTILLIMEPKMMYSKFLQFTETAAEVRQESLADIENELRTCIPPHGYADMKLKKHESNAVDNVNVISMPIIACVKSTVNIKRLEKKLKRYLSSKLKCIDKADSDILLLSGYSKGHIVCSNLSTLQWLTIMLKEYSSNLSISTNQLVAYEFRKVIMLSQIRSNNVIRQFENYMKEFKKYYPDLRTEMWKCCGTRCGMWNEMRNDWKLAIEVDIQSIAYLELYERRILVDELVFKFQILYVPYKHACSRNEEEESSSESS